MGTQAEKSGVHLTGADSGWPTGSALEPPHRKDGTGADPFPDAASVAGGVIVDDGTDEVQTATVTGGPTGGNYVVDTGADTSSAIAHNATAAAFLAALLDSDDFDEGDVAVAGNAGGPYTITFGEDYGAENVPQLSLSANNLTGGTTPSVAFATTTPGAPL